MEQAQIIPLIRAYIAGTLTVEERSVLHQLLQHAGEHEQVQEILAQLVAEKGHEAGAGSADWEKRAQTILDLDKGINKPATIQPFMSRRKWYWAAAAVLLLLAGSLFYQVQQKQLHQAAQVHNKIPDIAPGTNKAELTLADGTKIQLDSTGKQLIQQGNTAVQQNAGMLSYHAQGDSAPIAFNTLTTPRGGKYQVTLPDGTKVWLNAVSSLTYPTTFPGTERVVELSGEAYFEVAEKASQPFRVKVNTLDVKVLGTHFNIHAYADENNIQTTLVEGSVSVTDQAASGRAALILKPGQQAAADLADHTITSSQANVKQVLSWKNDLFIFEDMRLAEVLREISRWYDVEIEMRAPVNEERYTGVINRKNTLSKVLALLEENNIQHFKIEERKIIVLP
jgi:ferric-dicitrate binding protein FerR (iron transport regulator)